MAAMTGGRRSTDCHVEQHSRKHQKTRRATCQTRPHAPPNRKWLRVVGYRCPVLPHLFLGTSGTSRAHSYFPRPCFPVSSLASRPLARHRLDLRCSAQEKSSLFHGDLSGLGGPKECSREDDAAGAARAVLTGMPGRLLNRVHLENLGSTNPCDPSVSPLIASDRLSLRAFPRLERTFRPSSTKCLIEAAKVDANRHWCRLCMLSHRTAGCFILDPCLRIQHLRTAAASRGGLYGRHGERMASVAGEPYVLCVLPRRPTQDLCHKCKETCQKMCQSTSTSFFSYYLV